MSSDFHGRMLRWRFPTADEARRPDSQLVPLLAVIPGTIIAGLQCLIGVGHFVALYASRIEFARAFPVVPPIRTTTSDYLHAAGYASLNFGIAALCIAAMALVVRSSRRDSPKLTLLGLAVVATIGIFTFTPLTYFGQTSM